MSERPPGRRSLAACLAAALATLAAAPLWSDPLYVIEQLMVNVSSAPDASGERVATLKSGERVEELERAGDQVHVKLANGREGWVRASYLTRDEPLRVRLAQRDAEVTRLGNEVSALKAQLAAHPGASAPNAANAPDVAPAAAPVALATAQAPPAAGSLFSAAEERPRTPWPWVLATALIGFGVGFAAGALMLDRHIRRKYGGLRIY
ncbi:MAG: SH3 domain-containing protein [Gammaproteobacteria bacterium]|nr:SH3 domain-containing protein [Gammaproteobacteria bacterium]